MTTAQHILRTPDSTLCEIINPSDPYTLRTCNFEVAAVAIALLGNGRLGLQAFEGEQSPVLFGWDEWLESRGLKDDDAFSAYFDANRDEMVASLQSVVIGSVGRRRDIESMLSKLPEDKQKEWLEERHDRERSSMNDIGSAAWKLAEHWSEKA